MIKRLLSATITLAVIAAMFFFAGGVQAETTTLSDYAGIAAYANIGSVDLEAVKSAFVMIEYQDPLDQYFVGTLDLPSYEDIYNPLVLVTATGDIVAFYHNTDPSAKIVDVISKNLDETLLEQAVKIVAGSAGVDTTTLDIPHYDFGNPDADKLLLLAEYQPDGNTFTLQFDATYTYIDDDGTEIIASNSYYEKSYAFYRTFAPSFTLDNDLIDQVNFIGANEEDFIGTGYYGTIYGHFSTIDFDPEYLNSFAVEAGDGLGFGALAILYSGGAGYTAADKDFERMINLTNPGINPTFDLMPGDFSKNTADTVLNPLLTWTESSAPQYEYCIDTSDDSACDTEWISTGANTSAQLSDLHYETTYYWQVRAINSSGVYVYANPEYDTEGNLLPTTGEWWSFTTGPRVLPEAFDKIPTDPDVDLKEPLDSLSKITMTWGESYGAYYYEVCVDTGPDCTAPEKWHNVGLATTATIGDLLLDTTYYWQVRAVNDVPPTTGEDPLFTYADGEGESYWQSFTTRRFSKLRPMENEAETYNVTLPIKWEETPLATDGYEYCYDTTNDNECDNADWHWTSGTSDVLRKLVAGETYYWQVRTAGSNVGANNDVWWSFKVLSRKDSRKLNLFKDSPEDGAVEQAISGLELAWSSTIQQTASYQYCYFPVDDTDTTPVGTCPNWSNDITTPSITIGTEEAPLDNGTTYYWQVRTPIDVVDGVVYWLYADKGDYWSFTTVTAE